MAQLMKPQESPQPLLIRLHGAAGVVAGLQLLPIALDQAQPKNNRLGRHHVGISRKHITNGALPEGINQLDPSKPVHLSFAMLLTF
jgi:hypothetical protein